MHHAILTGLQRFDDRQHTPEQRLLDLMDPVEHFRQSGLHPIRRRGMTVHALFPTRDRQLSHRFGISRILRHEQSQNHTQIGLAQTKHASTGLHLDTRENHDPLFRSREPGGLESPPGKQ